MPAKLAVVAAAVVVVVVNGENGKPPVNRFQVSKLLRGNVCGAYLCYYITYIYIWGLKIFLRQRVGV